jgi:hypothetical protein
MNITFVPCGCLKSDTIQGTFVLLSRLDHCRIHIVSGYISTWLANEIDDWRCDFCPRLLHLQPPVVMVATYVGGCCCCWFTLVENWRLIPRARVVCVKVRMEVTNGLKCQSNNNNKMLLLSPECNHLIFIKVLKLSPKSLFKISKKHNFLEKPNCKRIISYLIKINLNHQTWSNSMY